MARIPVERERRGSPWWIWLIGLIIIACIIWLLAELFNPDTTPSDEVVEGTEEVQPVAPLTNPGLAAGTITDIDTVFIVPDRLALVGSTVQLDSMRVASVVGDSTFYVTPFENPDVDHRIFVVLDEVIPAPPDSVEGRYNVEPGQVVTLTGTLQQIRSDDPQNWGVTEEEAQQMQDDQLYLRAQRLEITQEASP
ncbi:MAG TPA: hypothetical protein VFG50_00245 [Rhodothermales bacterium]|nr:hypothetical protein [Rhodothermales bacterium]